MEKLGRALVLGLLAVLFTVGIFVGFKLGGRSNRMPPLNPPAILVQVQALSELVTVKYVIEKVEVLEVPSENIVGQAIGSQNRLLLLAHGVVKAGIDLDQLKPEDIEIRDRAVSIRLPKARITDAYLDEKETRVIDRTTGLLAPSSKDLEQTTRRNALDTIRRSARNSGILNEADQRARAQLQTFFTQLGFEKVEFK